VLQTSTHVEKTNGRWKIVFFPQTLKDRISGWKKKLVLS
jgi:hypothetical protein